MRKNVISWARAPGAARPDASAPSIAARRRIAVIS
jgi:hypothetical protein